MKETYLSRDFRETVALRFPARAKELNTAFDIRLSALLAENAGASKEKQYHLKRQILPGISAYETLQRVMPKEEALQTVHGYVEHWARTSHKQLAALLQYLFVRAGEVVQAGQPLGTAGETGRSTGAHLHFELLEQGVRYDAGALLGLP